MKSQKKPCLAYGAEAGQMEPFLAGAAGWLCRDTYFITRTEEALAVVKQLGLHGHTGADAAWQYKGVVPSEQAKRLLRSQRWDGNKPLLGIAVINPSC